MKIKKLYMRGFKSFVDRLEISFPFGISGIVGPNGCGKSNIVDAIRWCMGEQSPKQLRGRRMEDVIFAGAGNYKPLGMAEVSILLENGNGTFPPAFAQNTELSVTRRLYRSGESEYLINRVPCRLKDIQEIFMDTGLGNKAYSIIGQGQISSIIEQKPEETRVMLEEAAGITKYRKKVEASQRKIELTELNLQRVEDILGEIQRQIRSLKRQASKARRYNRICENIQHLELTLYANNYHQLKEESGDRLKSTEDLVEREIAKSTEFSKHHAKIETMDLKLEEMNAELSIRRKIHFDLGEKVHRKETALESLKREIKIQEELEGRLKGEQEEIKSRLTVLKGEKVNLEQTIEKRKEHSRELEGEISLKEKRLNTRRELLKGINEDFEKARAELSAGTHKEVGLNHESGYLNKILDQITDSQSRLEKEINDINAKMDTIVRASKRKSRAREAAAERLQEIEASIQQQSMNCEALEERRNRFEVEFKSAESELNVCRSRFSSLKALTENFEGYKIGVRTVMKATDLLPRQEGHIKGLVADVIQVDSRYEKAVEAVLADRLQYVIVESQEDGKQAIEYLKDKARGRGSFVPLNELSTNDGNKKRHPQFPALVDFVSVPEKYTTLINTLLENTAVVKDLETALSAWKENEMGLCFVTIDGDIVDQRGVVSGGKLAHSSQGLLTRKREMTVLKKKSSLFQKKTEDLKLKLENINGDIHEKKASLETLTEDRWSCQEEINELDKMLFRLGQELDQLENLSQRISNDLDRKRIEQSKHKKELSRVEVALNQRLMKRQEEEKYFQKKEKEVKESQEEFDQLREELAKVKADYRIFKEEQRGLVREMEMKADYAEDSLKRLQKIQEDISIGHRRRAECQKRREALNSELGELYETLKQAEEALTRADHEREVFHDTIKEEESKADQLRLEMDALKDDINRSKMAHSEIRFKMNNLEETAKEKFNLNLPDVYEQYRDKDFSVTEVEERLENQKQLRQRLGEVNLTAIKEHEALKDRYDFIRNQREDLINSIDSLKTAIKKINRTSLEKFKKTFQDVDGKLKEIFPILFHGGTAGLRLTDETRPLESGVLVEVQPPGKRLSHMGLLSGGEKALVGMAFIFAIYMIKPSPFCLLDEVDAPLDEANIDRFNKLLEEIKKASQIIMVTHSRRTMEIVDRLYGITMEKAGISKTVSVDLHGIKKQAPERPPGQQVIGH